MLHSVLPCTVSPLTSVCSDLQKPAVVEDCSKARLFPVSLWWLERLCFLKNYKRWWDKNSPLLQILAFLAEDFSVKVEQIKLIDKPLWTQVSWSNKWLFLDTMCELLKVVLNGTYNQNSVLCNEQSITLKALSGSCIKEQKDFNPKWFCSGTGRCWI